MPLIPPITDPNREAEIKRLAEDPSYFGGGTKDALAKIEETDKPKAASKSGKLEK